MEHFQSSLVEIRTIWSFGRILHRFLHPFLCILDATIPLAKDHWRNEKHRHVDDRAKNDYTTAREANQELSTCIWHEHSEEHHVIHDYDQLHLVEDVHALVKLLSSCLYVTSYDYNGNTGHVEDEHLQPQVRLIKHDADGQHHFSDVVHLYVESKVIFSCVVTLIHLSELALDVRLLKLTLMLAEEAQNENWEEREDRQDDACENSVHKCPLIRVVLELKLSCIEQAANQPDDVAFDDQAQSTTPKEVLAESFGRFSAAVYSLTGLDAVVDCID